MSFLKVNHEEAGKEFKELPEGTYICEITDYLEVKQSSNGNDILNLRYKVIGGENNGQLIFDGLVSTEKTVWLFQRLAKAAGIPSDIEFATIEDFGRGMQGEKIKVDLTYRNGTGANSDKRYQNVKNVTAPTEQEIEDAQGAFTGANVEIDEDDLPF